MVRISNNITLTEADVSPALVAFIGGMISGIFIVLPFAEFITGGIVIFAGLIEEPAKVIGLILIAIKFPEWLQSKTKGAVFGGLAGIGFAFIENLWYFIYFGITGTAEGSYVGRTIFSAPGHAIFSAIAGMGLVYIATKGKEGYETSLQLFFVAIFLHGIYNAAALGGFAFVGLLIGGIVFYYIFKALPESPISTEEIGILRLPNREIRITQQERSFGRKDFEGDVPADKLRFISKEHFKIIRKENIFYLEDSSSTGGTKLEGIDIKGKGRKKLINGNKITLPDGLRMIFMKGEMSQEPTYLPTPTYQVVEGEKIWGTRYYKKPIALAPKPTKLITPVHVNAKLELPGREIKLTQRETFFGKSDFESDISEENLSYITRKDGERYHFKIIMQEGKFYIQDEYSKNGTKLNNKDIKGKGRKELKSGDKIKLAGIDDLVMTFKIER